MVFPVARYLADDGHDVTLFLLDEFPHFLPEADMFDQTSNVKLVNLGWSDINFYKVTKELVWEVFHSFDYFIGTDYAPAILLKARLTVDLYFPAGGDLFDYPFKKLKKSKWLPEIFQIEAWRCAKYQKIGLGLVKCVSMDAANDDFETYLKLLNMDQKKRIPALPFLYMEQYTPSYFVKSKYRKLIEELRNANDFLIIQHCRQSWKCAKSDLHYKANDVLIKGFHDFKNAHAGLNTKLLLLEYGFDVDASRDLVKSLNMEGSVVWIPKMFRRDLMGIIRCCDVGVGELGRSWLSYGAVYEILAMKIPFVGNRKDEDYLEKMPELYSMYHAETREDVSFQFKQIHSDKITSQLNAGKAYDWFSKYAINSSLKTIRNTIQEMPPQSLIGFANYLRLAYIDTLTVFVVLLNKIYLKLNKPGRSIHAV